LRERSAELAAQLDAAVVTVDRSGIDQVLAESQRLDAAARAARADVSRRLAAGRQPGVPLGPVGPVRRVPEGPNGQPDGDPWLKGRVALTPELFDYWTHRRDVVAPAYRDAYLAAGAQYEARPSLLAAARGHGALLRDRESVTSEGGVELYAALRRFLDSAGSIREGVAQADEIQREAEAALERLHAAPGLAAVEDEHGPMAATAVNQWIGGRISAVLGSEPVNATTGRPVEAKPAGRRT
jgi:hypothetical protein